ncbi:MAG: DMT family transporter [Phormidesmis sp.]
MPLYGLIAISSTGQPLIGEAAALTAAILWAAATLMFGRMGRQLAPVVLNLAKGLFAIAFILITLAIRPALPAAAASASDTSAFPVTATLYLLLSGGIGIGLGDTAYFSAINTLGARRALLLETLAPPMAAVLAWIFLAEQLSPMAVVGIGLTLLGVAWVISERVPGTDQKKWGAGIQVALLATFCQASGAVLSRAALANTTVDPLWSSLLRLLAGLVFMGVLVAVQPQRLGEYQRSAVAEAQGTWQIRWRSSLAALKTPRLIAAVGIAAFFATYLGIWLQQIALKYTAAGIAQSLLATSPLFVLPMAALLGDHISWRATVGAAIALSGVWLLFFIS